MINERESKERGVVAFASSYKPLSIGHHRGVDRLRGLQGYILCHMRKVRDGSRVCEVSTLSQVPRRPEPRRFKPVPYWFAA